MIRALKLEWLKMKHYRTFWILLGMYLVALFIISSMGVFFLEWLKSKGADFDGIDPTILPIYDFPDIWQNITWFASFLKVLLAFIVVTSVYNDLSNNTLRQNIIDGISKYEYLLSKFGLIISLAMFSMVILFALGLINGSIYSHVWEAKYIFDELEFLLVYGFDIVVYCSLAFLLTLIIRKAGFVIIFLFLYTLMFEPIAGAILENAPPFRDHWIALVVPFLPIRTLNDLIPLPFGRYAFKEIVDNVPVRPLVISFGYLLLYISGIVYLLKKKDLK